ncbi:Peptidoglycan/LPS O-acetylase OafA/YrhL, contains acyltransferase and SGNH-hydrolase domains [Granulicella pectinivorans]|uniref:Peptidoglycan/LPS O-acetylase OafA/YrhL, contains acyltransferase and SGNH-hydrolase domains n=1 Tax=Granulicella pectinivorans TaxID=474950 RepID=A0A1I6LKC1_9BACT|nr:acyltransferase [Granulicella pectinivorans]SFS03896.1 Peptidoglycan/LPS O-acetylase OafA/YrhL, contains acyltransferase and SGNH-hydrolase domains [Granulicella pectinivorans]
MGERKHIPALDGLRGCAVLAVMCYHLGGGVQSHNPVVHLAGVATRYGFAGVQLFFVLSGFLITGILWDSKGSAFWWRNFFMRRALRIFPLYYASLLLNLIVSALSGLGWIALSSLWIFALYLQNFQFPGHLRELADHLSLPLAHYWSLAVEEQFYLIWPLVLMKTRTSGQAKVCCLAVVLISLCVDVGTGLHVLSGLDSSFLANMGGLGAGSFLALAYRAPSWPRVIVWGPAVTLAGLCGFLLTAHFMGYQAPLFHLPVFWLLFTGMLMLCLRPGLLTRLMSLPWLRWVGRISYGLYVFPSLLLPLTFWLVGRLVGPAHRELYLGLVFVVGMCVSFAAATLSFNYFEEPILKLKRKFPEGTGKVARAEVAQRVEASGAPFA